jgi:MoaD family protein
MTHSATSGDPARTPGASSTREPPSGPGLRNDAPAPRAVRLLLFAAAREAAGTRRVDMTGVTVGDVLDQARARFGAGFAAVLARSRIWVNGEPSDLSSPLSDGDEVAVLPPVSGGQGCP